MTDVTEKWRSERVTAALYDTGVQHASVAKLGAWAMWGADLGRMFADIARLADVPVDASVLDIPCGGGLAFRGLTTGQAVRYVAADISPYMLQRARREAGRRGVQDAIEFVEADVTALQFPNAGFDLCVTYNGLHCLPDPRAALASAGWDPARDVMRHRSRPAPGCPDRAEPSRGGVRKHPAHRRNREMVDGVWPRCRDT